MEDFIIENGVLKEYIGNDIYVTIPDGVAEIGDSAFDGCKLLKQIIIPNSVTEIGEYAFRDCTSLEEITIPNSVTCISDYTFFKCTSLQSITIPNSVTMIGNRAFSYCTSLQEIIIPNSVTKIGGDTFYNCTSLKKITIPDSVTEIGEYAFWKSNLKTKKSCYKAFSLNENNQLQCRNYIFNENEEPDFIEDIKVCKSGYHYCENLFEIFNYYSGELDVDIAIFEIEPIGEILKEKYSSKCCCQSFKFKKRLHREDVIKILNGGVI